MTATRPADLGQCFICVDPGCFEPGFEERLSDLLNYLRNMEPVSNFFCKFDLCMPFN